MTLVTKLHYDPAAQLDVQTRDVVYRRDGAREFMATLYEPRGSGPFPIIIDVHGGGWAGQGRQADAVVDEEIARGGALVAAIDFRTAVDAPHPAAMQDISYAVRWLKAHAGDFNASPERVGAAGWSSGGQQVMLSAMRPSAYGDLPLPEALQLDGGLAYVIMGWPVIDPLSRYRFSQRLERQDMIDQHLSYFGDLATMDEANPQRLLERGEAVQLPPALLIQGAADARITRMMAETFVETYSLAGGVIELGKYPGEPHSFLRGGSPNAVRAFAQLKSFIARQLAAED